MNKRIIVIFVITAAALVALAAYSFGPAFRAKHAGKVNPASLKAATAAPAAPGAGKLAAFHNRDLAENHYTVAFPADWRVGAGDTPGSYRLRFAGGEGAVSLLDVPDNSTLELFILSQEEPAIKKHAAGYNRVSYTPTTVNGAEAYQLVYDAGTGAAAPRTLRTYVAGPDRAAVLTFTGRRDEYARAVSGYQTVIASFRWEG